MKKYLFAFVSVLFLTSSAFAAPKPADAISFLQSRLGTTKTILKGHSPETYYECGIGLETNGDELAAYFFYPAPSGGDDIRGVIQIHPDTKVKLLDEKAGVVEVRNTYTVTEGGQSRKTKYLSRIKFEMNTDGSLRVVNIGWAEDNGYPLPMYGCVLE